MNKEVTTQEGADLMKMSHPAFIKLLDEGKIPFHRIGNSRKVNCADVISYKKELDRKRLKALDKLSELDQSMGLGY